MTKVNTPILSALFRDDFICSVIYFDDPQKANTVAGFITEFLSLIKSLPIDKKPEVATALKSSGVPLKSLQFLLTILDDPHTSNVLKKKLTLGHLELVYHGIRNDQNFARDIFLKIPLGELLDRILGFEDLSVFDLFLELLFPIAEYFAQAQCLLTMEILKLQVLREIADKLGTHGTKISTINSRLQQLQSEDAQIVQHEILDLKQRRHQQQSILKRKLFRFMMLIKTVLRMATEVRALETYDLTQPIDQLIKLADPDCLDRHFALQYIKFLRILLSTKQGLTSSEIMRASYLIDIIACKRLFGKRDNLLAGSVNSLLMELTKTHHFRLQREFVEANHLILDSASDYLYGAESLLKFNRTFKQSDLDSQKILQDRKLTKQFRINKPITPNERSPVKQSLTEGLGIEEQNGTDKGTDANGTNGHNENVSPMVAEQASHSSIRENQEQFSSSAVLDNLSSVREPIVDTLEDRESAAVMESFQREFEATRKKLKPKRLCEYDEDLNDAHRLSEFANRKDQDVEMEMSSDSLRDEEEAELNRYSGTNVKKNQQLELPQNYHLPMDFRKKSLSGSRKETAEEENSLKPDTGPLTGQTPEGSVVAPPAHHLDSGLESLLNTATQLKSELQGLKDWLVSVNSRMSLFNLTAQSKMNEIFTCKNCFQKYRLTDNQPGGCFYHSGRLRYLSCFECGSLEYYTCCRVCSKCKPGCNTSLHSPLVQYSITK